MVRAPRDNQTMDLLSWEPPKFRAGYAERDTRGGSLDASIARAVALALKNCTKTRPDIAKAMTQQLGRSISRDMLDAWASIARNNNRIPLDAFAALVGATEEYDLLAFIPAMFGYAVVPERYAEIIELHLLEEKKADLDRRTTALTARIRGARS